MFLHRNFCLCIFWLFSVCCSRLLVHSLTKANEPSFMFPVTSPFAPFSPYQLLCTATTLPIAFITPCLIIKNTLGLQIKARICCNRLPLAVSLKHMEDTQCCSFKKCVFCLLGSVLCILSAAWHTVPPLKGETLALLAFQALQSLGSPTVQSFVSLQSKCKTSV